MRSGRVAVCIRCWPTEWNAHDSAGGERIGAGRWWGKGEEELRGGEEAAVTPDIHKTITAWRCVKHQLAKELVIGCKGIFRTPKMLTYGRCSAFSSFSNITKYEHSFSYKRARGLLPPCPPSA